MYHGGKFRGQPSVAHKPSRDTHGLHPVHLTLHAAATPVAERGIRHVTPDRMTRDQATTFRPSDLPVGQTTNVRRASANSEASSGNSGATGPLRTIGFGPPGLLHTMSETRLLGNPNRRNLASPSKAYGTEYTQLSAGDHYRRHNSLGQESEQSLPSSNQQVVYQENISRTQSRIPSQSKSNPYLPGDRVIFAESPSAPGIPIVYRSSEERASNPDRLNLDRRHLTVCPILEGEEHLRLLNFQHNTISRIQHLSNLRRLIFLDLYDNQIEEMNGLSALKSLRVLMLGKNRIRNVSSLENLTKLDVLDLHGNQIRDVENLSHLSELRVLNLAGNQIEHVGNLAGMETLAELNLRRNCIVTVVEVDLLPSLQRLFLSFNNISLWSDIECLGDSTSLCEISLDGNPISNDITYKQVVLKNMPHLRQLDMKRISEDERRVAAMMMKKEEDRKREVHKQAIAKEKKRLAINNAARQWEVEHYPVNHMWDQPISFQDSLFTQTDGSAESSPRLSEKERKVLSDFNGRQERTEKSSWLQNNSNHSNNTKTSTHPTSLDISEAYLAEIEGENLQLFGPGALESLDKNWGNQVSSSVTTLTVQFINFDDFCLYINKIKNRFANVKNLILKEVNLHCLQQINAISLFRKLESLSIDSGPSNPVTQFSLWKTYTIFRLAHLSINKLNGEEIQASDIAAAEKIFGSLSLVATTQLSQFRLVALMGDYKQKQATKDQKKMKSGGDPETEISVSAESVGRSGLQYLPVKTLTSKKQECEIRRLVSRDLVQNLTREASDIAAKQSMLHNIWPYVFIEMVKDAVLDMNDLGAHVRAVGKQFEAGL